MRILSQDGMIFNDIPYENFAFGIARDRKTDKFCVVASKQSTVSESGFPLNGIIAEYSTEAKARNAMKMLHEAYSPVLAIKEHQEGLKPNIKPNDWFLTSTLPTQRIEVADNFYFQFPADDEVEV